MGQLSLGVVSKCDPHGFLGESVGSSPLYGSADLSKDQ